MTGRRLLVLGCGGHGRVVADAARAAGYEKIAFLDDGPGDRHFGGAEVLGPISMLEHLYIEWPAAIVAIGNNTLRLQLFDRIVKFGFKTPNIVHPFSAISEGAQLGGGIFLAAGGIVNAGAQIGDAVIINTGARIDHDCQIGRGSHVAPGASLSGNVYVGERVLLGTGCAVRQGTVIGNGATVGVGAAVTSNIPSEKTYVGVPARPLSFNE